MVTIGATAISEQAIDTFNGMIVGDSKYLTKLKQLSNFLEKIILLPHYNYFTLEHREILNLIIKK